MIPQGLVLMRIQGKIPCLTGALLPGFGGFEVHKGLIGFRGLGFRVCIQCARSGCAFLEMGARASVLLVERPAQAARTYNPTPIHLSCGSLENLIIQCRAAKGNKEQEGRGVWGVNPKP